MYLSPEQRNLCSSHKSQLCTYPGEKVDIYAAGLVLFEMCGQFKTEMERCISVDRLKTKRAFPKGFEERYYQESRVILQMTQTLPEKRPSAAQFLDKSPEHQCWEFEMRLGSAFGGRK